MKTLAYSLIIGLLFTGCGSKQYFEPEDTQGDYHAQEQNLGSDIKTFNNDGATLENNKFISKDGISSFSLKEGYSFINSNDGVVLAANDEGSLLIINGNKEEEIKFDKNIVSASIKGDLLALGFFDNSIIIYDKAAKQIKYKEYFAESMINDIKIANPKFMETVLLFPTLDGKVVIIDLNKKSVIQTINIDPESEINNIIFLDTIDDTLITATPSRIFTFTNGNVKVIDIDIKNIIVHGSFIYVATVDGWIIKYNYNLLELAKLKFKFAKFHSLGFGTSLYALESQGYMIKMNEFLTEHEILDFSFDEDEKVIMINNKIYFENSSIELK